MAMRVILASFFLISNFLGPTAFALDCDTFSECMSRAKESPDAAKTAAYSVMAISYRLDAHIREKYETLPTDRWNELEIKKRILEELNRD